MLHDADAIARSLEHPHAFAAVFDRHFSAIHRYVHHCLGEDAADDVAAETFVRAFAARRRYVATTPTARAWLFSIATNLVRDEVRRRARAEGLTRRLATQRPAQATHQDSADAELHAALLVLPEPEREVLLLFAWAQLTYEEIAQATGVPIGTVRSRLSRARTRLREALACTTTAPGGG